MQELVSDLNGNIEQLEDSYLTCLICAERYDSAAHKPILFRCGHTFCWACVGKRLHYKNFEGSAMGSCVVDRTQVLEGVAGRDNLFMLEFIESLKNMRKQISNYLLRDISTDISRTQETNEKLEERIIRIEELILKSNKEIRRHKAILEEESQTQKKSEITEALIQERAKKAQQLRTLEQVRESIKQRKRLLPRETKALKQALEEVEEHKQKADDPALAKQHKRNHESKETQENSQEASTQSGSKNAGKKNRRKAKDINPELSQIKQRTEEQARNPMNTVPIKPKAMLRPAQNPFGALNQGSDSDSQSS